MCHAKGHLFKRAGKQSQVWWMQASIWNHLAHSLCVWSLSHFKIQALGLSFYETRWLRRHLHQQDTALFSKCGTAEWMSSRATQKIDHGCSTWITWCPHFYILFSSKWHTNVRLIPLERLHQKFFQHVGKSDIMPMVTTSSETVHRAVTLWPSWKKIFCVLKFYSTKPVSTVHQGFQKKLHKIPPCVSLVLLGTFVMKWWKMSGTRRSIVLMCTEPQIEWIFIFTSVQKHILWCSG